MTTVAVSPPAHIPRKDALPEGLSARSECGHVGVCGCVHPRVAHCCFACPLVRCRYDEPGGVRAIRHETRNPQIVALYREGVDIDRLAERFKLSRRSVFSVVALALGGLATGKRRTAQNGRAA